MQELFNTIVLVIEFVGVGTVLGVFKSVAEMKGKQAQELALIKEGNKCQLRSEMLKIYYRHEQDKTLRQYELENFITLYNAYVALGGNGFMKKIHNEVMDWRVER